MAGLQDYSANLQEEQPPAKRQRITSPAPQKLPIRDPTPALHPGQPASGISGIPGTAALPDPKAASLGQQAFAQPPMDNGIHAGSAHLGPYSAAEQAVELHQRPDQNPVKPHVDLAGVISVSSTEHSKAASPLPHAESPQIQSRGLVSMQSADGPHDDEAHKAEGAEAAAGIVEEEVKQEAEEEVATGKVERATQAVATAIGCDICGDVMRDPVTAPECMHSFCAACIDEYIFDLQVRSICNLLTKGPGA